MQGPELARLAFQLGLAPSYVSQDANGFLFDGRVGEWQPHRKLAQADAVFRQLRNRPTGWLFSNTWVPGARRLERQGYVEIITRTQHQGAHYGESGAEEAYALLLCAVLALASSREP